jgi:hypothetical protein
MAAERAPRNNGSQWDGGFAALHVFENLESNRCDHVTAMAKKIRLGLRREVRLNGQESEPRVDPAQGDRSVSSMPVILHPPRRSHQQPQQSELRWKVLLRRWENCVVPRHTQLIVHLLTAALPALPNNSGARRAERGPTVLSATLEGRSLLKAEGRLLASTAIGRNRCVTARTRASIPTPASGPRTTIDCRPLRH